MIDRKEVEALRAGFARIMDGLDPPEWRREVLPIIRALPELLRVYALWLDAPAATMRDEYLGSWDAYALVPHPDDIQHGLFLGPKSGLNGKRVRLLPADGE